MKIDFIKAYDKVNWDFLILVLFQIGFLDQMVKWILAYVSTANFAVLINGSPTTFFRSSRGLRKGCSLSPLLFLLMIEGFSKMVFKSSKEGILSGINFLADVKTTHFLFVDDVIFFGLDKLKYWEALHAILDFFVMQHVWKSMLINLAYIPIGFRQRSCLN